MKHTCGRFFRCHCIRVVVHVQNVRGERLILTRFVFLNISSPFQVLIGYNRGLMVLWDIKESNADQTYSATQVRSVKQTTGVGGKVPGSVVQS